MSVFLNNQTGQPLGQIIQMRSEESAILPFRKEVIQPQVLLQLPCYDFTPVMNHTLGTCLPLRG